MKKVTLGLSAHRPEMLPLMAVSMKSHDAIFLEEPPTADFEKMLSKAVAIDDYLMTTDVAYPEFNRRMCRLLRQLNKNGKRIFQIEPFLEHLVAIHTLFACGKGPEDLDRDSIHDKVYTTEKQATKALLTYYKTVMSGSFDDTISAVQHFARIDAARFRLRDSLRAQALAPLVERYGSSYIEAGEIHYGLCTMLRQRLPKSVVLKPVFLAALALKKIKINGSFCGPGDFLTLLYLYHPTIHGTAQERLLAARSLIYAKIIEKEELVDDIDSFPHLRNETATIQTVNRLSLDDCRNLFPELRRTRTLDARKVVDAYLVTYKGQPVKPLPVRENIR